MERRSRACRDDDSPGAAAAAFTFGELDAFKSMNSTACSDLSDNGTKSSSTLSDSGRWLGAQSSVPSFDAGNLSAMVSQAVGEYLEDHLGAILLSLREGQESILQRIEKLAADICAANVLGKGGSKSIHHASGCSSELLSQDAATLVPDRSTRCSPQRHAARSPSAPPIKCEDLSRGLSRLMSKRAAAVNMLREFHSVGDPVAEAPAAPAAAECHGTVSLRPTSSKSTASLSVNVYDLDALRTDMVFESHGLAECPLPTSRPKTNSVAFNIAKSLSADFATSQSFVSCGRRTPPFSSAWESQRSTDKGRHTSGTLPVEPACGAPGTVHEEGDVLSQQPDSPDDRSLDGSRAEQEAVSRKVSEASSSVVSTYTDPTSSLSPWRHISPTVSTVIRRSPLASSQLLCQVIQRGTEEVDLQCDEAQPDPAEPDAIPQGGLEVNRQPSQARCVDKTLTGYSLVPVSTTNSMTATTTRQVSSTKSCNVDLLRNEQESKILSDNVPGGESIETQQSKGPPVRYLPNLNRMLRLAGILPLGISAMAYFHCIGMLLVLAICLGYSLAMAVVQPDMLYLHLVTACYSVGCFISMLALRLRRIEKLLGPMARPIQAYARNNGFMDLWDLVSARRLIWVLIMWILTVGLRIGAFASPQCHAAGHQWPDQLAYDIGSLAVFVIVLACFSVLVYMQLHVCCGLELAVDSFCVRFIQQMGYDEAVVQWGVVQALLRRAASIIDSCFLAQGTTVLGTLLLTGVSILQLQPDNQHNVFGSGSRCALFWSGWLLSPVLMLLYAAFRAAAVTEKCSRVPPFVNSWALEERPIDLGRQYAAQHIMNSAAGFYVKGVRLSGSMALKLAYLIGVVLFTFLTRQVLQV